MERTGEEKMGQNSKREAGCGERISETNCRGKRKDGKRWWERRSIFRQFFMLVAALLLGMMGCYGVMDRAVKEQLRADTLLSNDKILHQIEAKTSEFHNSLYNMLTLLSYGQLTYEYLLQDGVERMNAYDDLITLFSNTMLIQNDMAGIALYDQRGDKLAGVGIDFSVFSDFPVESELVFSNVFRPNSESDVYYTVSYPVFDLPNGNYGEQIGMVVLLMRADKFSGYLEDTAITENQQLYLVDQRDMVIAGNGGDAFTSLKAEQLKAGERTVQAVEQKETGWRIISAIPNAELYSGMEIVRHSTWVIYMMMLLGLGGLLVFCYAVIIRPIRKVDAFIKNSAAQPTKRLNRKGTDEIGMLARNLDKMLDERDEMGEKLRQSQKILYETELAKHQMQVLAYRNQINPHFLYNTFECIRAMALYYDAEEIAEITMALSRIFRYAIKGKNVVSVGEEIRHIREYATIIHYRFGGRIRVEVDVEETLLNREIIKLILQPLVENSIFHGLEQKMGEGIVTVLVQAAGEGRLCLSVEDDGLGMEEGQVKRLLYEMERQSLNHSSQKNGIGLANIYQRLRLFYGERAVFVMESTPGAGTRVRIEIPEYVDADDSGRKEAGADV